MEIPDPGSDTSLVEDLVGTCGILLEQTVASSSLSSDYDSGYLDNAEHDDDYVNPDPGVPRGLGLCKGVKVVDINDAEDEMMEYDTISDETKR